MLFSLVYLKYTCKNQIHFEYLIIIYSHILYCSIDAAEEYYIYFFGMERSALKA
jgi:hypothetical protein